MQVNATTKATQPWIPLIRFRRTSDFLFVAVVLDDARRPVRTYLVPGDAWEGELPECLGLNEGGSELGPYVEVRTGSARNQEALEQFALERVVESL